MDCFLIISSNIVFVLTESPELKFENQLLEISYSSKQREYDIGTPIRISPW